MPFLQLTGGAYQTRSLIAGAQRCLNLFPEATPSAQGEPFKVTHYCTPGLTRQAVLSDGGCRGMYVTTTGDLYACYGQHVFHIAADNTFTNLGIIHPSAPSDATPRDTPVCFSDNGFVLIMVDGSVDGYFIDLTQPVASQTLTRIDRNINTGWLGANSITYQDTFFICNSPGTVDWYVSLSNITSNNLTSAFSVFTATIVAAGSGYTANDVLTLNSTGGAQITVNSVDNSGVITGYGVTNGGALNSQPANPVGVTGGTGTGATFNLTYETNTGGFDPLDFVGMTAQSTECVGVASVHRTLWILGSTSYEIWINTGGDGTSAGSFPFSIYPTGFGNWGCCAKASIGTIMNRLFWLSQDKHGFGLVMMGEGLNAQRVSTHAIEFEIAQYDDITDASAYTYQQMGHMFYVLNFPSAKTDHGATWVYDVTTNEWHERCYIDDNGVEYRHLVQSAGAAYDTVYAGDWRNGNLYAFDLNNYTDDTQPIKRVRSFPHQIDLEASRRVMYHQLIAQMQVGSAAPAAGVLDLDCTFDANDGTLLQDFHNSVAFGANFTKLGSGNAVIVNDAVVGQTAGSVLYKVAGAPAQPDYAVKFKVQPTSYGVTAAAGTLISAIGRANGSNLGYEAEVSSNGTQYIASLTVMPSTSYTVNLGTISSGYYLLELTMQKSAISLAVFRSQDSMWLAANGTWQGIPASAIQIQDSTYQAAGSILIAGTWD